MKFYRNIFEAVVISTSKIFNENFYADKVIEKTLRQNPKWGSRDRKIIAETVYELVRWKRLYLSILDDEGTSIENVWKMVGVHFILQNLTLPNWNEFSNLNAEAIQNKKEEFTKIRKIRESIPDWLDERGYSELGDQWSNEISALNKQASVVIRTNEFLISRDELQTKLLQENIDTYKSVELPSALILNERKNIFKTISFKSGFFEVQDISSQLVAPSLVIEPGMRIIDACAGAGGKTLHIATLLNNKGKVIALDTETWKLNELKKRAGRNKLQNIETRLIESQKTIKRLKETADRLLLDVPCSGIGVLKRNPDTKWKLTNERINELILLQKDILSNYQVMLKPGGILVYATCSILPSENQYQIKSFLEMHKNFSLIEEKIISPSASGFDGFYIATLKKH